MITISAQAVISGHRRRRLDPALHWSTGPLRERHGTAPAAHLPLIGQDYPRAFIIGTVERDIFSTA
jgi:hypothetical protein